MLTRSGLRASSGSTPKKEVQPSSTSTPQRGAVKRKYVKRKPLEKLNPPLEHQSPIFNIHIHVHSSNADSTSHLSQVPSVVHVHLDNYKTHSTETSATVKKRRYRKRKFSTVYDSTNDEEESEKLDLTDNESLQNATENVSPKSNSSQTKVNLKNGKQAKFL